MKLLVGQLVAALLIAVNPVEETHSTCPADWPVDELIAVLNKRPLHVKNPLPDTACINLWLIVPVGTCHEVKKSTPPENPNPEPAPEPSTIASSSNDAGPASASSKDQRRDNEATSAMSAEEKCNETMEAALAAGHNVDVGDQNFAKRNYNGALTRYRDAAEQKPHDAAIHVRLGRTLERMDRPDLAAEQYNEAVKLGGPEKYVAEAKSAMARLEKK